MRRLIKAAVGVSPSNSIETKNSDSADSSRMTVSGLEHSSDHQAASARSQNSSKLI
jgi:hypothetical protein